MTSERRGPAPGESDRRVSTGLVALEGGAGVVAGVGFVIAAVVGRPHDEGTAALLGVLVALYGAGVLLVARGLWRQRSWARTPALLVQFFALVVAWYQHSTLPVVAALLALVAVVTLIPLLRGISDG